MRLLQRFQLPMQVIDLCAPGLDAIGHLLGEDAELRIRLSNAACRNFDIHGEGPHIGEALTHVR